MGKTAERSANAVRRLQLIRASGCKAGLVFNPATPLDILKYVMDKVDIVLLMFVAARDVCCISFSDEAALGVGEWTRLGP